MALHVARRAQIIGTKKWIIKKLIKDAAAFYRLPLLGQAQLLPQGWQHHLWQAGFRLKRQKPQVLLLKWTSAKLNLGK